MAKTTKESMTLASDLYSFIARFKRTKLIVALLFGGSLFSLGLASFETSAEFAMDCFQLSAYIVMAYIGGQSLVDFAEKLKGE
jgi:hypothetical protein